MSKKKPIFPIGAKGTRGYKSHVLTYEEGMALVEKGKPEHLSRVMANETFNFVDFHATAVRRLLRHIPKRGALRCYMGKHEGRPTLVLAVTDENGKDVPIEVLNAGSICPPNCTGGGGSDDEPPPPPPDPPGDGG